MCSKHLGVLSVSHFRGSDLKDPLTSLPNSLKDMAVNYEEFRSCCRFLLNQNG